MGSVIGAADASGASLSTYAYDEYGRPDAWSGFRLRYTGQMMLPEAQLYHYRARAYSPALGRFLQSDPILYAGGMNLYAYVQNDPLNWGDPSGFLCQLLTTNVWEELRDRSGRLVSRRLVSTETSRIGDCSGPAGGARGGSGEGGGGGDSEREDDDIVVIAALGDDSFWDEICIGGFGLAGTAVGAVGGVFAGIPVGMVGGAVVGYGMGYSAMGGGGGDVGAVVVGVWGGYGRGGCGGCGWRYRRSGGWCRVRSRDRRCRGCRRL